MSVFGIGAGKMELRLNKIAFHPGEKIEGTARLTASEEVKARGLEKRKRKGPKPLRGGAGLSLVDRL